MKALEQLILSKSRPVQKEAKRIGVSELDKLIMEALLGEASEWAGKGTDLEQALVDAWDGKAPSYFKSLVKLMVPDLAERYGLSGKAKKLDQGTLSDFWVREKGADKTSKADIKIGEKNISMKMGPSAMLFGFGPGDAKATLAAAIITAGEGSDPATAALKELLGNLERSIGRAPLGTLKKAFDAQGTLPDNADAALQKVTGGKYQMDPAAREKLKKRLAAKDELDELEAAKQNMLAITTTRDLLAHAEEILELEKRLKNIENEVVKSLDPATNPALRYAFYKEALTAEVKFGGVDEKTGKILNSKVENIANSMLVTQDKKTLEAHLTKGTSIEGLYKFVELDTAHLKQVADAAQWRGKFRSDSLKYKVAGKDKKSGYNLFRASIIAEIKETKQEQNKYLQEFRDLLLGGVEEGFISEKQLLEEGLGEWVGKLASYGKDMIKKGAEAWSSFIVKVSNYTERLTKWFENSIMSIIRKVKEFLKAFQQAIAGGTRGLMKFMGIELNEYVDAIEVDVSSPPASIFLS